MELDASGDSDHETFSISARRHFFSSKSGVVSGHCFLNCDGRGFIGQHVRNGWRSVEHNLTNIYASAPESKETAFGIKIYIQY